jgi:hypothetical protein
MGQEVAPAAPPEDLKSIRIPITVSAKKLYPFDVLIDNTGTFMPISESKVNYLLFDPVPMTAEPTVKGRGTGEFVDSAPGFTGRSGYGAGGLSSNTTGTSKLASVLDRVRVNAGSFDALASRIDNSTYLARALEKNAGFRAAMTRAAKAAFRPAPKAVAADANIGVLQKTASGYRLLHATTDPANYRVTEISKARGAKLLPTHLTNDALIHGAVLLPSPHNAGIMDAPSEGVKLSSVVSRGVCKVLDRRGQYHTAIVMPNISNIHGEKTSRCLTITKHASVVGQPGFGLPDTLTESWGAVAGPVRGEGCFIVDDEVYGPVSIRHKLAGRDLDTQYRYETDLGEVGTITMDPRVSKPVAVARNEYLFPKHASIFVPLRGKLPLADADEADVHTDLSSRAANEVVIKAASWGLSGESRFTFTGGPLTEPVEDASYAEALLVLGSLGAKSDQATSKLAAAVLEGHTTCVPSKAPGAELEKEASVSLRVASEVLAEEGLSGGIDLVKEAAAIGDPETIDNVLALNFLTPENVHGFLEAIPEYESSLSKLCELLVAARLGLSDVPERAVSSAVRGVDGALQGLKKLQLRYSSMQPEDAGDEVAA